MAVRRRLVNLLTLLSLPAVARAGQVRGHVLGPDGKPLPGATVTLTNDLLGFAQSTVAEAESRSPGRAPP